MARYFADDGWNDITIAFSLNVLELEEIGKLAASVRLNVLVEEPSAITTLGGLKAKALGVYIKIDSGLGRTGVDHQNVGTLDALIDVMSRIPGLTWKGFLTHAGNTYRAQSKEEVVKAESDSIARMLALKKKYAARFPSLEISIGDTPGVNIVDRFDGVDELRPGNFVFYDVMQEHLGSCTVDDIAVAMACPVVAVHSERNTIVVYGGAIHFSKDFLRRSDGSTSYGSIVEIGEHGWSSSIEGAFVSSLSQEHGIISAPAAYVRSVKVGDVIAVLPVHSCLTADCMGGYLTLDSVPVDHMQARSFNYSNNP